MIFIYILLFFTILGTLFAFFAPQLGRKPFGEHLEVIKKSPHYQGRVFENSPIANITMGGWQILTLFWEMLTGKQKRRPSAKLPSHAQTFTQNEEPYLTWFGHSTFLYEIGGKKILFDPMLGTHAAPLPIAVSRFSYDLPSSAEKLPELDAVIISHDHYDHLDYGTIQILKHKVKRFITPLGVGSHLRRWGVAADQITELDWWNETTLGDVMIAATPSQHFSGRSLTDRKKTLWASWVIKSKTANLYFGGDSGYFPGFKKIGEAYGPFDLTLLDSAQYNDRWKIVHMVPEQSIMAHKDLLGQTFMPIHWSAFTLALHAWTEPIERALAASTKEQIDLITPMIGQRFNVLTDKPKDTWWRQYA